MTFAETLNRADRGKLTFAEMLNRADKLTFAEVLNRSDKLTFAEVLNRSDKLTLVEMLNRAARGKLTFAEMLNRADRGKLIFAEMLNRAVTGKIALSAGKFLIGFYGNALTACYNPFGVIVMRKVFLMTLAILLATIQSLCSAQVEVETAHYNGSENLIYPIVHTGNAEVDEKINLRIVGELRDFIKGCHYAVQYDGKSIGGMHTSFEVPCNCAGNTVILSIIMTESVYYEGAAHPTTFKHALNFNADSGAKINLGYLIDVGDGSNPKFSLENVSEKVREHVEREGIHLFENALPLKNYPEYFYFDENLHVHFLFGQDQIAPYAAGIIDVDMDK